ncbi:hypothetical protein BDV10DRAFT_132690 [Aspergillus recurvatus]
MQVYHILRMLHRHEEQGHSSSSRFSLCFCFTGLWSYLTVLWTSKGLGSRRFYMDKSTEYPGTG